MGGSLRYVEFLEAKVSEAKFDFKDQCFPFDTHSKISSTHVCDLNTDLTNLLSPLSHALSSLSHI